MLNRYLYRFYSIFYLLENWRRRKFTPASLLAVPILVVSAVLGVDTTRSMIYHVFALTLPLLVIALIWSSFFRFTCRIKREFPKFATVDEKLRYKVSIENLTESFQKGLSFYENPEDPRPTIDELLRSKEPDEEKRNIWDRKSLYFRWLWLVRKNQKAWFCENPVPDIPPNSIISVDAELVPLGRGYVYLSGATITRLDPFGLFKAFSSVTSRAKLLVLPRRYEVPALNLPGTREYNAGGVALASSVGNSDEFISLRDYRPGDPVRHIHWKSLAKTGKLVIKEFQDEYFVRHALILDTFDTQNQSELFEEAVSIASSYACAMELAESILDLMFVGNQAYCFSSGRGLLQSDKIMEILACVRPCRDREITSLNPLIDEHAPLLSGSVCILLAWDDQRRKIVEKLNRYGIPALVIVVTDDIPVTRSALKEIPANVHFVETGNIQKDLMLI